MHVQEIYCSSSSIDILLAPGATAYNGTGGEHSVLFLTTPAFWITMACVDYFFSSLQSPLPQPPKEHSLPLKDCLTRIKECLLALIQTDVW